MTGPNFVFEFANIKGLYDFNDETIYIFGEMTPEELAEILVHESLHHALKKAAGEFASLCLDNLTEMQLYG